MVISSQGAIDNRIFMRADFAPLASGGKRLFRPSKPIVFQVFDVSARPPTSITKVGIVCLLDNKCPRDSIIALEVGSYVRMSDGPTEIRIELLVVSLTFLEAQQAVFPGALLRHASKFCYFENSKERVRLRGGKTATFRGLWDN